MKNLFIILIFWGFSINLKADSNPPPLKDPSAREWVIQKDHSEISFEIPYMKISKVRGIMREFEGGLYFDTQGNLLLKSYLVIKADSLFTNNSLRDGHLKNHDFLNVKEYPFITLRPQKFLLSSNKKNDPEEIKAMVEVELKGIKKILPVNLFLTSPLVDTWGKKSRFLTFSSKLHRQDFGIHWNKTLGQNDYLLGETVTVTGTLQLQPAGVKTPGSQHLIPDTPYIRLREQIARGEKISPPSTLMQGKMASDLNKELPHPQLEKPSTSLGKKNLSSPSEKIKITDRLGWWVALSTLGLFGFFGVIIIGIYLKRMLINLVKSRSEKNHLFFDQLFDLPIVALVFIYSLALWVVGWR